MIKRILIIATILASTVSLYSQSLIKTSPVAFSVGILNAVYEVPLNKSISLQGTIGFSLNEDIADGRFGIIGLSVRSYLHKLKEAPNGFYIQGGVLAGSIDGDSGLIINFVLGYQWIWESGFVLDLGLGPAIDTTGELEGVSPYPIASVGYQF